jgi:uncharacterized protein with LGFP repeats
MMIMSTITDTDSKEGSRMMIMSTITDTDSKVGSRMMEHHGNQEYIFEPEVETI